ncbi:MAG: hypothetical protein IJK84_05890 [Bacteroidales bacterium]|nr:hypothetical protein [Bacteroidales bacterium]
MNGFLIFLAVALWFGLSVRKAFRKQVSELESETASSEGTVKNAFESLFDEVMTEEKESRNSTFAKEAASAGYYSYESTASAPQGRAAAHSAMSAQAAKTPHPVASKSEVLTDNEAISFDLRQAVIYQTILTNKYLNDTQTYDN